MGGDEGIESLPHHHEQNPRGVGFQIGDCEFHRSVRAPEGDHERPGQKEAENCQRHPKNQKQNEGVVENPVGFLFLGLAKLHAGPGRTAQSDEVGKGLKNDRDGQDDPQSR